MAKSIDLRSLTVAILAFTVVASSRAEIIYEITPASIDREINARGLRTVHAEIFSDHFATNMFLLAIDSGQEDWLLLARQFMQLNDPQSITRLYMALGEALQWSPGAVLAAYNNDLQRVCSLEGFYEWRLFSRFLAETALNRRMDKLQELTDDSLLERKAICLNELEKAKLKIRETLSNKIPVP